MRYRKDIIIGQKFNKLTFNGDYKYINNRLFYICFCECNPNKFISIRSDNLLSGNSKSCGCILKEKTKIIKKPKLNIVNIKEIDNNKIKINRLEVINTYTSWRGMIQRCTNPNDTNYHNYGVVV